MRAIVRSALVNCAMAVVLAVPAAAQTIMADLVGDVNDVERKFVALAKAIPADKYEWRPGPGVRSVAEVVRHVASDNYLIPAGLGFAADPATGITGDDFKTAQAFEHRTSEKDASVADLEKSFAHLKRSMQATSASKLNDPVKLFGQPFTMQKAWVLGTTHLHEHLGQLIAYARTNGVVPPWSK